MQFSSIWPIDKHLSDATTPVLSGPGSSGIEVVLHIPQSSTSTEASSSDCLVFYPGQSLAGGFTPLQRSIIVFYIPIRLGNLWFYIHFIAYIRQDKVLLMHIIFPLFIQFFKLILRGEIKFYMDNGKKSE